MEAKCPHCKGKRVVQENKGIKVQIERGMSSGDTIIMEKEAEQVPDMALGDLIFTIKQKPHSTFKRVGNNLFIDITLTLEESLLGFTRTLTHLDGHIVKITSEKDEII
jgi:DnaJ-class molecular chaperone